MGLFSDLNMFNVKTIRPAETYPAVHSSAPKTEAENRLELTDYVHVHLAYMSDFLCNLQVSLLTADQTAAVWILGFFQLVFLLEGSPLVL